MNKRIQNLPDSFYENLLIHNYEDDEEYRRKQKRRRLCWFLLLLLLTITGVGLLLFLLLGSAGSGGSLIINDKLQVLSKINPPKKVYWANDFNKEATGWDIVKSTFFTNNEALTEVENIPNVKIQYNIANSNQSFDSWSNVYEYCNTYSGYLYSDWSTTISLPLGYAFADGSKEITSNTAIITNSKQVDNLTLKPSNSVQYGTDHWRNEDTSFWEICTEVFFNDNSALKEVQKISGLKTRFKLTGTRYHKSFEVSSWAEVLNQGPFNGEFRAVITLPDGYLFKNGESSIESNVLLLNSIPDPAS